MVAVLPKDRLRSCAGWRKMGNKTLAVDQRLLQVYWLQRSQEKAVAEALKPRNTDTATNFSFLQIIRTWLITSCKNDAEEERSMLNADCKACSHSIAIHSAIASSIGDGIFAPSHKTAFPHWSMCYATAVVLVLESLAFVSVEVYALILL